MIEGIFEPVENQIARVFYGICFLLLVMFDIYKLWFLRSEAIDFEKIIELIVFSSGIVAVCLKVSNLPLIHII